MNTINYLRQRTSEVDGNLMETAVKPFSVWILLAFFSACDDQIIGEPGDLEFEPTGRSEQLPTNTGDSAPPPIKFDVILNSFIKNDCLGCHSNYSSESQVLKEIIAGNPEKSPFFISIDSGYMPPSGKLPQEKIDLLQQYILDLNR